MDRRHTPNAKRGSVRNVFDLNADRALIKLLRLELLHLLCNFKNLYLYFGFSGFNESQMQLIKLNKSVRVACSVLSVALFCFFVFQTSGSSLEKLESKKILKIQETKQRVISNSEAIKLSKGKFLLHVGTEFFSPTSIEWFSKKILDITGYEVLVVRSKSKETILHVNGRISGVITDDIMTEVARVSPRLAKKAGLD